MDDGDPSERACEALEQHGLASRTTGPSRAVVRQATLDIVLFPAPFSPTRGVDSPGSRSSETSARACVPRTVSTRREWTGGARSVRRHFDHVDLVRLVMKTYPGLAESADRLDSWTLSSPGHMSRTPLSEMAGMAAGCLLIVRFR